MSIEVRDKKAVLEKIYGSGVAGSIQNATISENTRAALYVKGKVCDIYEMLCDLHELIYGVVDDDILTEFTEATGKLDDLADRYIMASINDNIGVIGRNLI